MRALALVTVLTALVSAVGPAPVVAQRAANSDVESIDAIITAVYDVISG